MNSDLNSKTDRMIHASNLKMKRSEFINDLHLKALDIVRRYKTCEVELIDILEQADTHKVHYILGYSSLFKYATDGLGLSSEVAYIYINVARKAKEVPALKEEIQNGAISLSKAKRISSVLNKSNQDHWLSLAKTSTKRELEKQVAAIAPRELVPDKMQYVPLSLENREKVKLLSLPALSAEATDGINPRGRSVRVQLQVGISEGLMLKLRRAQDLLSQKRKEAVGLEEVLDSMVDLFLERNDPVKKAERQKIRGKLQGLIPPTENMGAATSKSENKTDKSMDLEEGIKNYKANWRKATSAPTPVKSHAVGGAKNLSGNSILNASAKTYERKPLHSALKHAVYLEHQGQCSHRDKNGVRCSVRRHLEIHHKIPVASGGTNELSNLTLYCYGHHRGEHSKEHTSFNFKQKSS